MSSPLVSPPLAKTKAMYCPNCGGPVEFRGFGHALTVVCPQCLSVLDASSPLLKIVQQAQHEQSRRTPLIPLGQRGKWANITWECIGFQTRAVVEDGVTYEWEEYLLFNPYEGFRYITNYQGHFNFVTPIENLPTRGSAGSRPTVYLNSHTYRHFSGAQAVTSFVLGEFPWRVKVGEQVLADDFISPPLVLSSETTSDEITWSLGVYTPGADIWKAFALAGAPPKPQGVYLNQVSPHAGRPGGTWGIFAGMTILLILLMIMEGTLSHEQVVFDEHYKYSTLDYADKKHEPSFVTKPFEITGGTANAELTIHTNLINNWAYFNFTLVNETTGDAFDFGREVTYYTGSDEDGSWSEGNSTNSATIPHVSPGRYYLRIEPEMEGSVLPPEAVTPAPAAGSTPAAPTAPTPTTTTQRRVPAPFVKSNTVYYEIVLKQDVAGYGWYMLAFLALLVWPIFTTIRARSFEKRRWSNSDYGGS